MSELLNVLVQGAPALLDGAWQVLDGATKVVAVSAGVTAALKAPKTSAALGRAWSFLNVLALNVGHARNVVPRATYQDATGGR